jgi:hypothetical protein
MKIRLFEWRDLPVLHRFRHAGLFLDSASALIDGTARAPIKALFASLMPATGILTYLCEEDKGSKIILVGQVSHPVGAAFARLSFLTPESAVESAALSALCDQMTLEMGERGAFHLLSDVDEASQAFEALHRAGFAIYARQRIWKLESEVQKEPGSTITWKTCMSPDMVGVRTLYNNLVPGLVQQVEPMARQWPRGKVYYHKGDLLAYVELRYGRFGVWAQPFVHPDAQDFSRCLVRLLGELPNRRGRPVYLCIRSYQSWLEAAIDPASAAPGPQQAVMVRHLTIARRATQALTLPAMNGTRAEPTAPIVQYKEDRS